jgi:hypothetical protein
VRWLFAISLALAGSLLAGPVAADDMDISLARLRVAADSTDAQCLPMDGSSIRTHCPDNPEWQRLMSELGGTMIPTSLAPARTLGYGGFYVGVESWIAGVDGSGRHWSLGTEGDASAGADCGDSTGLGCNRFPSQALVWSRVNVRKGFPFGFELGTSVSHLWNTQLWAWGLEVKWAIFEGYRTGFWAFIPDIAVRGMVNTLVGDPEFNLTIPSFDVIASKPITVFGSGTVTPFGSLQFAWLFADSELIDFTPEAGAGDGANNAVFDRVRSARYRLTLGVQGRYQAITLSASFSFDLVKPSDADSELPDDLGRQWMTTFGAGLTF